MSMSARTAWSEKGKKETDFSFFPRAGKKGNFPFFPIGKKAYIGKDFPYFLNFPFSLSGWLEFSTRKKGTDVALFSGRYANSLNLFHF